MKKARLFVVLALGLLLVTLAAVASAQLYGQYDYGCWICSPCPGGGGVGLFGPSKMCCTDVGDGGSGTGILCSETDFGELGRDCQTSGGACYQCYVTE